MKIYSNVKYWFMITLISLTSLPLWAEDHTRLLNCYETGQAQNRSANQPALSLRLTFNEDFFLDFDRVEVCNSPPCHNKASQPEWLRTRAYIPGLFRRTVASWTDSDQVRFEGGGGTNHRGSAQSGAKIEIGIPLGFLSRLRDQPAAHVAGLISYNDDVSYTNSAHDSSFHSYLDTGTGGRSVRGSTSQNFELWCTTEGS